ncbi:N-acetylmuramoyl-L-alanine amidase [Streptomyces sp. NBRC 110611]|uniref:N-acetylmuramoyl-L-alanine amidase n=1 Tax=Streptomyces sp. NBRC 110611 TaxID=1621259 RepID=UPI00082DF771|nr:N-acetylmuramoyl-L-alanine amidase [Streptomyces sp. NBRC 110611]GAU66652.1 N-acetylmuramoyl-L-alanine amidase [Streptomyces sp. NBRC 110611]
MATPLSADALVTALRNEGVTVVEHPGWRTHNRAGHGPWGPVNGVVIHHTVTRGTDSSVAMCWDGYDDLPGPLCHGVVDKTGTVHLVGNGRANHAGRGDSDVLNAVIAEDYNQTPPQPTENDTDGNARFYGFECINLGDGNDPWPAEQLDAIERIAAAICRAHGWTAKSVIGHKEWTNTKIDPSFGMPDMRARITHRLGAKPEGTADTKPTTNADGAVSAVSVAHLREAARRDPRAAQGHTTYETEVEYVEHALIAEGLLDATWGDGSFGTKTITAYAAWQRRLGYTGRDADGIPGRKSLTALGRRYDFDVTD